MVVNLFLYSIQGSFSEDNTFLLSRLGEAHAAIGVVEEFWAAGERS